jgi:hypothetical protein
MKLEVKRCTDAAHTAYLDRSKNQPLTPLSQNHPFEPFPNTARQRK